MTVLTKLLMTCVGIAMQTALALLIIGANRTEGSQFPVLLLLIIIQAPLVAVVWARHVKIFWRILAYAIGTIVSVLALCLASPYDQSFALSVISSGIKGDSYGSLSTGLLGLFLFLGCLSVFGFMIPRAILSFGRRYHSVQDG